jgi:Pirin-related protein
MTRKRTLVRIEAPKAQPGFLGSGHMARPVVAGQFGRTDPFILLMDDVLNKKDYEPAGGPHPHAGFETVTLVLDGELGEGEHKIKRGDFQMMTAGSGVVHTEVIDKPGAMRILQLWLDLPKKYRHAQPRVQTLPLAHVPSLTQHGVHIKLYSGSLAGLTSPVKNYVPLILADISLAPHENTTLQIPANYNTFLYVLDGTVAVSDKQIEKEQVGWLDISDDDALSELALHAGPEGTRFVLYAGQPTGEAIVSYGPFIADSTEDISRLYKEYRQGKMNHINLASEEQKLYY